MLLVQFSLAFGFCIPDTQNNLFRFEVSPLDFPAVLISCMPEQGDSGLGRKIGEGGAELIYF